MRSDPLLQTPVPLVAAPMAGGPTTVALARATAAAGAFPFLAGGYQTADALMAQVAELRESTPRFGVNLFVLQPEPTNIPEFRAYAMAIQPEATALGVTLDPRPRVDTDDWDAKIAGLVASPVPVVSLTFGLPVDGAISALQQVGTQVYATVTSAAEANLALGAGVDGLVVQGAAAGGHSAIHDQHAALMPSATDELVAEIRRITDCPLIAAGGVDGPSAVSALLSRGASAVAVGTLLLRAHEAGTSPAHRSALTDPRFTQTVLTRAFTGRLARALDNDFTAHFADLAIESYPAVHHLTRPLRTAASRQGDTERLHLWAGTGYRAARDEPASEIISWLATGCHSLPTASR